MPRLIIPTINIKKKKIHPYISFLIIISGIIISICIPLVLHKVPGPDAVTLFNAYSRADNCNFWNPFSPDRSSYECSAYILRPTGMDLDNAWMYGMFCNFLLTTLPLLFFRRIPITVFFILCLWGVVRSFFLEPLTKEILVAATVISILLFTFSNRYRIGFFFSALTYGVLIRPYWILFSLTWIAVSFLKNRVTKLNFIVFLGAFYIAVAILMQALLGISVSSIRAGNNESRVIGEEGSRSIIVSWLQGGDVISQGIDSLIIFFRLTFPFELVVLSGPSQIIFLLLMIITSVFTFKIMTKKHFQGHQISPKVKELTCIPFSFLLIQGLFEPDFGSFARHFAMVVPVLFCALGLQLSSQQATTIAPPTK